MSILIRSLVAVAFLASAPQVQAQNALGQAVQAANSGEWTKVDALRPRITNRAARDVIDWMRLRGRQGTFGECRDFVARNADWPGLKLLKRRCEYSIPRGANPAQVIGFFQSQKPQTGTGSLRLAEAHLTRGQGVEAAVELKRGWLTFNMSQPEHDAFVTRNPNTIRDLHEARLDMLLWRGSDTAAERMLDLVGPDAQGMAETRMALRAGKQSASTLVDALSPEAKDHPGLSYDRYLWRSRKGLRDGAVQMLLERSTSKEALGRPDIWSPHRRTLAREYMRSGNPGKAYLIASSHFLESGRDYADLEWLSGYLALRKLGAPAEALVHFERFRAAVETPISLGRAGFWLGEAYAALDRPDEADKAYAFGARYQSSFYGQLAAEKADLGADAAMAGGESFPDWRGGSFRKSSVFVAAMQLHEARNRNLTERFLVHLGETQSREALGQMADLALELQEPHIALMISKEAARQGLELYKTYFPLSIPAGMNLPVSEVFALSIARRESEFDPVVISPAGARGLMQLMPGTAREVAGKISEPFALGRLLSDPRYNARLGSAYLAELSARFGGNPVLMSVAYNAGPSRANRWMDLYGDPRGRGVDIIDWIEGIPFRETRNYVMRVTESFAPYRARLTGKVEAPNLTAILKGGRSG